MHIIDYNCITAAGFGPQSLMHALYNGQSCGQPAKANTWSHPLTAPGGLIALIPTEAKLSMQARQNISFNINSLWNDLWNKLSITTQKEIQNSRLGLIFSSTKGYIEDFVSTTSEEQIQTAMDPYIGLIKDFQSSHAELPIVQSLAISNACCSSHVALEYIQDLFATSQVDYALLIAVDVIGPFIYNGFQSLKVLSHSKNQPFAIERDGLQLGEAIGLILLSKKKFSESSFVIKKVASETEGSSITRPSVNGQGLLRTLKTIAADDPKQKPDLVVAHGTGTKFNDLAEDQALSEFSQSMGYPSLPITNTKWCIGHTLGASGTIDLIAACEILKTQKVFNINSHSQKDPSLKMHYLLKNEAVPAQIRRILITSLGFGGVHASLLLEKPL